MIKKKFFILGFISTGIFSWVLAQPSGAPSTSSPTEEGELIAAQGTKAGAAACNGCHGPKGEGMAASNFPRLAGEPTYYMVNQLKDYASGVRDNPVMSPIAKAMTDDEKEKVSAYFTSLPIPPLKPAKKAGKAELKRGETLAATGDMKIFVQACNNCHGPGGRGVAPAIPSLAAQHPGYLAQQIAAWKSGARKNSPEQMAVIAKRLTDKDIQALGAYFESVSLSAPGKKK
jgi:cytochrome c553